MREEATVERCSLCNAVISGTGQKGYEPLTVDENDKEIILQHCPRCGALLIHIETVPVHSR